MKKIIQPAILLFILASCSTTKYFVVRHAEKETTSSGTTMSTPNDPPLSEAGRQRAEALKERLKDEKVAYIFSTQTRRTLATAEPLHELYGLRMNPYNHRDTLDKFVARVKSLPKGNVLIVGHSNTVDDVVNAMMGEKVIPGDLSEAEYDNLFIITRKGKKYSFRREKYGVSTPVPVVSN